MKKSKSELLELKDHIALDFPEMLGFGHQRTTLGIHRVGKNGKTSIGTVHAVWDGNRLLIPKTALISDLFGGNQEEVKE